MLDKIYCTLCNRVVLKNQANPRYYAEPAFWYECENHFRLVFYMKRQKEIDYQLQHFFFKKKIDDKIYSVRANLLINSVETKFYQIIDDKENCINTIDRFLDFDILNVNQSTNNIINKFLMLETFK